MSTKKKSMTAAELLEQLKNDNDYQEMMKTKEAKFKKFEDLLNKDEQPIIEALKNVGIKVNSVWDLVNTSISYPNAIPVLVEHLQKSYHLRTKAGIARALAVKEAKDIAWDTLLNEYEKAIPDEKIEDPNKKGYKQGLSTAISYLADINRIEVILKLIQNKKHGSSRVFFVDNLFKWRTENKVMETVEKLKNDKDVSAMIEERFKIK
jgi:hypothetical protein